MEEPKQCGRCPSKSIGARYDEEKEELRYHCNKCGYQFLPEMK